MRNTFLIVAAVVVGVTTYLVAGAVKDRELPGIKRGIVVRGQGYFPVAMMLQDGRVAVVLRGGAEHLGIAGRLDIVFSSDQGRTWSKPTVVVDSPADDRNPAFGQAKDGTLVVGFWRTARYDDQGRYNENLNKPISTWVTRSEDGGKTWSDAQEIDVAEIGWGSPYGKILALPDGAMLMNIYGGAVRQAGEKVNDRENNAYLYRSTDNGRNWKRWGCAGARKFNETGLVRLTSGQLLAAMRSDPAGETWLARSNDDGRSWSEPAKLTPAAVHPADLVLLPDNRVLLVTGYRVGPFGVRGIVGDANGRFDWEDRRFELVNDATSGDCGYPSSVVLKDGRVMTVYYAVGLKGRADVGVHCGVVEYGVPAER